MTQRRRQAKTQAILDVAVVVLRAAHPMTVRQAYYQLVARQVIENTRSSYHAVSKLLVDARKEGIIPWEWIEDRLRRPRRVGMWEDLADFAATAQRAYRRQVWATQPGYLEVWVEKDALSGILEDVLLPYGVTLNVGRGYDGWDFHSQRGHPVRCWRGSHRAVLRGLRSVGRGHDPVAARPAGGARVPT